jgi:hypothetical protein
MDVLQGLVQQERAGAPSQFPRWQTTGGMRFSPSAPLTDAMYGALAGKVGIGPEPIGSSIYSYPPGMALERGLQGVGANTNAMALLNALPPEQANRIAMQVMQEANLPTGSPTQLRLQRALADLNASRAGIAPTAFGGAFGGGGGGGGVPGYGGPFVPPMPGVSPMLFGPGAQGQEPEPFVPYGQ